MPLKEIPIGQGKDRSGADVDTVYGMIAGLWVSSAVRAAAELDLMDALSGGPIRAADAAAQIGADSSTTQRLLVVCATLDLVEEQPDGAFTLTSKGRLLADGSGSLKALAKLQGAPGVWQLWAALPEAIRSGGSQAVEVLGSEYFRFLGTHPQEAQLFQSAMHDLSGIVVDDAIAAIDLGLARTVCDVGGGDGTFLFALLAANPQARGRVLDQAQVVEHVQDAPGSVRDRFSVVEGDFFADIPAADYYVLKNVLHDWPDDACLKILQNCRRNAPDGARLVIVETMINRVETNGARLNTGAFMDMTVLTLVSGRERRQEEFEMLLEHAGWTATASVRVGTETTLLEAKPS